MSLCSDPPFPPPEHTRPSQKALWGILACFTFYKTSNTPSVAGQKQLDEPIKPDSKQTNSVQCRIGKLILQKKRRKFCKTVFRRAFCRKNGRNSAKPYLKGVITQNSVPEGILRKKWRKICKTVFRRAFCGKINENSAKSCLRGVFCGKNGKKSGHLQSSVFRMS